MATLYITASGHAISWPKFIFVAIQNASPFALTAAVVKSFSCRGSAALVAIATVATVLPFALAEDRPDLVANIYVPGVDIANFGALLISYLALMRPIRAIGPMVFVFTSAFMFGFVAFGRGITDPDRSLAAVYLPEYAAMAARLGLDTHTAAWALLVLTLAAFALAGWIFQAALSALYTRRYLSDQSLMIDMIWLNAAIASGAHLAAFGMQWPAYTLAAFLLYKSTTLLGFRLRWGRLAQGQSPPALLHLRVFALGKQSRDLCDAFSESWRYVGHTRMIAGPDLAGSTVEPHEFLEFASGRLSRRFIADADDLARHIGQISLERDHDGRFRVADFFCRDETWRSVLQYLVRKSDAALIDLRGFGPKNTGCIFEINELLANMPLNRVFFVVDKNTDIPFLEDVLSRGLADLPATAPNSGTQTVRVFTLEHRRDAKALLVAVATASAAQPWGGPSGVAIAETPARR